LCGILPHFVAVGRERLGPVVGEVNRRQRRIPRLKFNRHSCRRIVSDGTRSYIEQGIDERALSNPPGTGNGGVIRARVYVVARASDHQVDGLHASRATGLGELRSQVQHALAEFEEGTRRNRPSTAAVANYRREKVGSANGNCPLPRHLLTATSSTRRSSCSR
jgi:hypothetical protein